MDRCLSAYKLATRTLKGRLIAPYQRDGVHWLLRRELSQTPPGGFLCDEMGLGKTVQMISTLLGNPKNKTLIIVPKSIVQQWVEEIDHFAPDLRVKVHDGPKRSTDPADFEEFDVVVAPYSLLVPRTNDTTTVLHNIKWDRVILDEGHEIRNKKSKIHKSVCLLKSEIRWVLSGTPVYNSIRDFVALCNFLGFSQNYVLALTTSLKQELILRRTKEDVAEYNIRLKLPPCDFENVELDMNEDEKDMYRDAFLTAQEAVRDIFKNASSLAHHSMEILEHFLRCRQSMTHPQIYLNGIAKKNKEDPEFWDLGCAKFDYLLKSVLSHPSEKSLIFSQFVSEMEMLSELFRENGIEVFRIEGSVSKENREIAIKQFKKTTKHCVFLIQIKAGGQGLNLQEATRVYITSPSWNPATELQAIGRSHRTGQSKKVVVRKLIYSGFDDVPSIEHSIMALQGTKSIVCAEVLNDERILQKLPTNLKNKNNISIRDLKKIFHI